MGLWLHTQGCDWTHGDVTTHMEMWLNIWVCDCRHGDVIVTAHMDITADRTVTSRT